MFTLTATVEYIVIALACALLYGLCTFKILGALQQAGYNGKKYAAWTHRRGNMVYSRFILLAFLTALAMLVLGICFSFAGALAGYIALIPIPLFAALYCVADKRALKVPLVSTARANRIYLLNVLVIAVAAFVLGAAGNAVSYYCYTLPENADWEILSHLRYLPLALLPLQEGVPLRAADPESVVLWPGGARITAHEELTPETSPDGTEAFFVVPAGARDMEISVEGARLLRWSSTPCFLPAQGGLAHERQEAQENLRALRGEQAMLRAVLDTWTKRPVTQPGQDLEQLASRLENRVPALVSRLAQVSDIIAALEEVEKKRPALSDKGQKILLELRDAGASVVVRYRYTLPDCGWQPRYVFDAIPDESGKNANVRVRLEASVRQFSGMDWRKSRLFLALRPHDVVAPPSLPQWVVDDMPQARAMPMMAGAPRQRAMAMKAADAVNEEISLNTEGQDARWEVSTPGLPQGESVVTLRDEIWTAALERVARPDENDGRVWLTAKADLPAGSVWPDGQASFQLEGIPAGERFFAVKDGKAQWNYVQTALENADSYSIADGLKEGDTVIVTGNVNLAHESPVTVVKADRE